MPVHVNRHSHSRMRMHACFPLENPTNCDAEFLEIEFAFFDEMWNLMIYMEWQSWRHIWQFGRLHWSRKNLLNWTQCQNADIDLDDHYIFYIIFKTGDSSNGQR